MMISMLELSYLIGSQLKQESYSPKLRRETHHRP